MLRGKTRGHHLFVEGECDVCTVILVIGVRSTFGLHRLETGRATLAHISAGADKTLVIQDGDAALPTGAITVPFVDQARSRATPDLEREESGQLGRYTQQQFQNSGDLSSPPILPWSRQSFHSGTGRYCSHHPTWPHPGSHSPW